MKMKRRFVVGLVVGIGLIMGTSAVWSQAYPSRPIRLIVPYPPGGAVDPIARTIAQKLSEAWGQPVVVDNKPGAGTIIGTEIVAKAAPDGYTVILATISHTMNPAMYGKLPYDPVKDFTPLSLVSLIPLMLVVNPQVPVKSVKELIDLLKAKPGQLNFSSAGNGTSTHLAAELFKALAGVDIVHVPYKGSGASVAAVMAGETQVAFDSVFLQIPQVKAGKLRALAVTGTKRTSLAPELPTVSEAGLPGYEVSAWVGLLAPAGTPPEVVQKWNREIARILQLPEVRERQISQGNEPVGSTAEYFADFIKTEISKWGEVVKQAGIKLD